MRTDIRTIRDRLHANTLAVFGDGVDRLKATASEAAERGLHVYLQPRLGDRPQREILEHLAETGRHAERLRRQGARVILSVGCEFVLFVPGIVPGDNAVERIENLSKGKADPKRLRQRLADFINRSAAVGRSVFQGPLTYGAADGDQVDWNLFDIVSVNYYSYFRRRSGYVKELAAYQRWGKPVLVSECGACTYEGAPKAGGMAWQVVDYSKPQEEVVGNLVRSERTQADYLSTVLEVFDSMNLYGAMVYQFVTPDAPHRREPRLDLDMASYSLVKTIKDSPSRWHWEPKQSFHAVARQFARRPH
ncbi:hypothetical protein [Nonomuraea sp. JJY05]|uniref:hypothetical protein n=1 Tax=Nonomuraea sp. JJY05 TaxID=3350255 RepID=UPI00373E9C34